MAAAWAAVAAMLVLAPVSGAAPVTAPAFLWAPKNYGHSDINLAVMDNSSNNGEDQRMLLEEGIQAPVAKPVYASFTSQMLRLLFFMDQALILENRLTLRAISEFGGHLLYFYVCDRTNLLGESGKVHQDKSAFTGKSILYLNRHQTEEWKGWMQVLFLMYHYFNAKEIYNAIRVFIAAYVWMTGFGNFPYYYVRKDFSISRFAQVHS
ncbi:hypothetical protein ABZP36_002890 [Zizania latifolia]